MYTSTVAAVFTLLLSSVSAAPTEKRYTQVQFTNAFPSIIYFNQSIDLTWEGGSGHYEVYDLTNYLDESTALPIPFVRNSTQTSYLWNAGDNWAPNTTIQFGVADTDQNAPSGSQSYQLSQSIPIANN